MMADICILAEGELCILHKPMYSQPITPLNSNVVASMHLAHKPLLEWWECSWLTLAYQLT